MGRDGYPDFQKKEGGIEIDYEKHCNRHKFLTLDDESVTYAELRQNLKKCNFSDVEIEMFMSQYDTNENEQIDEDEAIKVFKDLAQGKNITGLQENLPKIKVSRLPPPNEADVEK